MDALTIKKFETLEDIVYALDTSSQPNRRSLNPIIEDDLSLTLMLTEKETVSIKVRTDVVNLNGEQYINEDLYKDLVLKRASERRDKRLNKPKGTINIIG